MTAEEAMPRTATERAASEVYKSNRMHGLVVDLKCRSSGVIYLPWW